MTGDPWGLRGFWGKTSLRSAKWAGLAKMDSFYTVFAFRSLFEWSSIHNCKCVVTSSFQLSWAPQKRTPRVSSLPWQVYQEAMLPALTPRKSQSPIWDPLDVKSFWTSPLAAAARSSVEMEPLTNAGHMTTLRIRGHCNHLFSVRKGLEAELSSWLMAVFGIPVSI